MTGQDAMTEKALNERYPERARMMAVGDRSQAIGEFIEWLQDEHSIYLMVPDGDDADVHCDSVHSMYVRIPIERLLARFFDIDLEKIDREKGEMMAQLRAQLRALDDATQGDGGQS